MGKRFKRRTKPIILIILICFVSINVFPYDIIGIMIENSKENAKLKDAYLLLRKGYEESLDSLGEYEIVRESEEKEFYLLKRGGLTDGGIDSMYMELNGKDYNNIFMLDTPDYSGEFNIQKGRLHRAANRDLIRNLTTTSIILVSNVTALFFANNEIKMKIGLLALPYTFLSLLDLNEIIMSIKVNNEKRTDAEENYEFFNEGRNTASKDRNSLTQFEIAFWSIALFVYSVLLASQENFDLNSKYLQSNERYIIVSSEIICYVCGLISLNCYRYRKSGEAKLMNKYYYLGVNYE